MELRSLARRLGGIRELVAPKRRAETEGMSEDELVQHLARNPGHVRRPLIDTGRLLTAGFTAETRAQLEGSPTPRPKPTAPKASKKKAR